MNTYTVTIDLNSLCYEIEADSEDEAVEIAFSIAEWSTNLFDNCVTNVEVK